MFKLADKADVNEAVTRLRDLNGQIPSLLSLRCGPCSIEKPNCWDIALTSEHEDEQGLADYIAHPAHKELLEWLSPRITHRAVVDSGDFR